VAHLKSLIASDKRGDAVRYFMTKGMGAPGFVVTMMRFMPGVWARLKAVANTLPYDAMMIADHTPGQPLKAETWARMTVPTLVMSGSKSAPALLSAARNLVQALSNVQERVLEGVSHTNPNMKVIGAATRDFFKA
jgi:pimeloyl-ACP methyl ester carboxylesterase